MHHALGNFGLIPSFISTGETQIESNHPDILPCWNKYEIIVGSDVQISQKLFTYSKSFGHVLRVRYYPISNATVLKSENIFLCWNIPKGALAFVVSNVTEEDILRDNLSRSDGDAR